MTATPDPPPEELGRSYEALLQQQAWDTDVPATTLFPSEPETTDAPPAPWRIVEALLFVGGEPLSEARACELLRGLTAEHFHHIVSDLNQQYRRQRRPYLIQVSGAGYVLTLTPRYRVMADKLFGSTREARLSQAAVDVLALVAYRQPATKQEIDNLRGADSASLLRQLVRRGLIWVTQRGEANQREVAYGTTPRFLELFGLTSLEDLPRTQEVQQI